MFSKKEILIPSIFLILFTVSCGPKNPSNVSDDSSEEHTYESLEAELAKSGIKTELTFGGKLDLQTPYVQKTIAAFYENDRAVIKKLTSLQNRIYVGGKVIYQDATDSGKQTKLFRKVRIKFDGSSSNDVARIPGAKFRAFSEDKHIDEFSDDIEVTIASTGMYTEGKKPYDLLMRQIALGEVLATMKPETNSRQVVQFLMPVADLVDTRTRTLTFSTEALLIDRKNFDALLALLKTTNMRDLFGKESRSITFGYKFALTSWDWTNSDGYTVYRKLGNDAVSAVKALISENK